MNGLIWAAALAIIVGAVVVFPMLTIWSLNALFGTGIEVSLGTWAAAFWLTALVGYRTTKESK